MKRGDFNKVKEDAFLFCVCQVHCTSGFSGFPSLLLSYIFLDFCLFFPALRVHQIYSSYEWSYIDILPYYGVGEGSEWRRWIFFFGWLFFPTRTFLLLQAVVASNGSHWYFCKSDAMDSVLDLLFYVMFSKIWSVKYILKRELMTCRITIIISHLTWCQVLVWL